MKEENSWSAICKLQSQDKFSHAIQSEPKGLTVGRLIHCRIQVWKSESQQHGCLREEEINVRHKMNLPFPYIFAFFQTLHKLYGPHPQWQGLFAGMSSGIPVLISSGNICTDTLRNNDLTTFGASHSPVKLKHKIQHHTCRSRLILGNVGSTKK